MRVFAFAACGIHSVPFQLPPPAPPPLIIMLSDVTWKNLPTGASELASNDAALGAQPSDQSSK